MEEGTSIQRSTLNLRLVHRRQEFELVTVTGPLANLSLGFKYMVPTGPPSSGEGGPERQDSEYRVRLTRVASINPEYGAMVLLFPPNGLMLSQLLGSCSTM